MKKKHQITYLAAEAKAREEELQNQWAQNRNARRQTQNKYGFQSSHQVLRNAQKMRAKFLKLVY